MRYASALLSLSVVASALADNAKFTPLNDPAGKGFSSVKGISGDGTVVVGSSNWRWTAATGSVNLPLMPGASNTTAVAISSDGSTVVGYGRFSQGDVGFRWTATGGNVSLGGIPGYPQTSQPIAVSSNGSVIVGRSVGYAWRWSASTGMTKLADFGNGNTSEATACSADGTIVAGFSGPLGAYQAFRHTSAGGITWLGDLPGGSSLSLANAIASDGSTIVGYSSSSNGNEAFRWTEAEGMIGLGDLAGGSFGSYARAVSGDGSVIVGDGNDASGSVATYWSPATGLVSLKTFLQETCRLNLSGWSLRSATAISLDGKTIAGWGINPKGQSQNWLVYVPEPGSLMMLALAGVLLRWRGRATRFI